MNAATRRTERSLSLSLHAEVASGSAYEAHKEAAKNDNLSAGSRIGHGIEAVKSKGKPFVRCSSLEHNLFFLSFRRTAEEKGHEAKKEAHKEAAEERGVIGQIGDTISNAYHYVTEKVSG